MTNNKNTVKEHAFAIVLITIIGIFYIYNMFTNKPWYDELYTYYYFISRGPIYAAIHWPVPNNHVGYSVTSAFLDYLGNPYIGLRGVSCIAGIANLVLIYRLCLKFMNKWFSLTATALYGGAYLVFRLAIQGRGYALAITCLLLAATAVYRISIGDCRIRNNVLFAAALTYGLYIVPCSLYWVAPVCVAGGLCLLCQKRYKDLINLIVSGVIAAFATFFLYLLIWLAIGANLICKNAGSPFYGLSQVKVILKAPFASAKTGMDYMLATPYIQSIDRVECIQNLPSYFISLFGNFYDKAGLLIFILSFAIIIANVIIAVKEIRNGSNAFLSLFTCSGMIVVPIMLIIQSVHPYLRVLSFFAVFLAIGFGKLVHFVAENIKNTKIHMGLTISISVLSILIALLCIISPYYSSPLAERENNLEAVLSKLEDPSSIDSIFYLDDFQKYVIRFYYDATPNEVYTLEEAQYVIAGPEFTDATYEAPAWPVLYGYSPEMIDYVNENMSPIAEADGFTVYKRK